MAITRGSMYLYIEHRNISFREKRFQGANGVAEWLMEFFDLISVINISFWRNKQMQKSSIKYIKINNIYF